VRRAIAKFCSDERGATSVEYGLIAAVMGLGLVASLSDTHTALAAMFAAVADALKVK
jgi:pilus assembly protein Flp/PilA